MTEKLDGGIFNATAIKTFNDIFFSMGKSEYESGLNLWFVVETLQRSF